MQILTLDLEVEAGNYRTNTDGHKSVQLLIDGRSYQANRLVILYVDGYLPDKTLQVDHKNGTVTIGT